MDASRLAGAPVAEGRASVGRYELRDVLGRGGIGVVYRARDPGLGRDVALKVLLAGSHARQSERKRFLREARAVARLEHPHIVHIYDIGEHDDHAYFTMQLIEGPSLLRSLRSDGPRRPEDAAVMCAALARALHFAHEQGLVHRDVKPGNILLDGARPLLSDFGLVKDMSGDTGALTRGGQVLGTPAYMSPEQLRGELSAIGPASDQYSLGVVLHEMLTGDSPFRSATPVEIVQRVLDRDTPELRDGPAPLRRICLRAMAHEPGDRYPDCQAMADDLERFVAGEPVLTASPGVVRSVRRSMRRHRRWLPPAALAVVVAVAAVASRSAWVSWQEQRAEERRQAVAESRRMSMEQRIAELAARRDFERADEIFDEYIHFRDNAETRALARAWLGHGASLSGRVQRDESRQAYARAYALADNRSDQAEALIGVAVSFRAEHDWDRLNAVLATMQEQLPEVLDDPRITRLQRDDALVARRIRAAAALATDPAAARLLTILGGATPTPHRARVAYPWDIDRDGTDELLLSLQRPWKLVVVGTERPGLPLRMSVDLPVPAKEMRHVQSIPVSDAEPPMILMSSGLDIGERPRQRLWRLPDAVPLPAGPAAPLQHVAELSGELLLSGASGDLDGDGDAEIYIGATRQLHRLDRGGDGGWVIARPHRSTTYGNSEIRGLVADDLDLDGRSELVAITGDWASYDIRLFEPRGDGDSRAGADDLRLVTRYRLGRARAVTGIRIAGQPGVAVIVWHDPPRPMNHRVYRPDEPQGRPRGVHLLTFRDGVWRPVRHLSLPELRVKRRGRTPGMERFGPYLQAGDLDGDGLQDLVMGMESTWAVIFHQRPDGSFDELVLDGLLPLAIANVDDDEADELLVSTADPEGRVWVLGAGDDELPPRDVAGRERLPGAGAGPSGFEERWARAEALIAMGLHDTAADRFETLAKLSAGTAAEGRALLRAAQIVERVSSLERAARLFERAADFPAIEATAWEGAFRCYLADHWHERALDAARARLALTEPPPEMVTRATELERLLGRTTIRLDFSQSLDERVRILAPLNVRRDTAGGGLHLTSVGQGKLLELPLQRTEGHLRVAVKLDIERLDWASQFEIRVVRDGAVIHRFSIQHFGGGEVAMAQLRCPGVPHAYSYRFAEMVDGTLEITMQLDPASDNALCSIASVDGAEFLRRLAPPLQPVVSSGPVTLQIHAGSLHHTTAEVLLRSIELDGFALRPTTPTPIDRIHHWLAMGQPSQALEILDGLAGESDPARAMTRALILDRLGQSERAAQALEIALAHDAELGGLIGTLFRDHLERFEGPLRAALGDEYYQKFWTYNADVLVAHESAPHAVELLTRHLDGLDGLPLDAFGAADASQAHLWMLARRAGAWRQAGRLGFAKRDIERALTLGAHILARERALDEDLAAQIGRALAYASRERAVVELTAGQRDAAIDALLQALHDSPSPEVFADTLVVRKELAALRDHPRWAAIELARRLSPEPAP